MKKIFKLFAKGLIILLMLYLILPNMIFSNTTTAITMSIEPVSKLDNGNFKTEYLTGEEILTMAKVRVSGNATAIENAILKLTLPKKQVDDRQNLKPSFSVPVGSKSHKFSEDANNWYAEYQYDALNGGTIIDIPFTFRMFNITTEKNMITNIKWELINQQKQVVQAKNLSYKSLVREKESYKIVLRNNTAYDMSGGNHVATRTNTTTVAYTSSITTPTTKTHTESGNEAPYVTYEIGLTHKDKTSMETESTTYKSTGTYVSPNTKIVDKLPAGAKMFGTPNAEGKYEYSWHGYKYTWTYDSQTHTATFEGQIRSISGPAILFDSSNPSYLNNYGAVLKLSFPNRAYSETHVNKATIIEDEGKPSKVTYSEKTATVKFNNVKLIEAPYTGITRGEKYFKYFSNYFSEGTKPEDLPLTFNLGFGARAVENEGVNRANTYYLTEIEDYGLDPNLYYSRIKHSNYFMSSDGIYLIDPELVKQTGYYIIGVDASNKETLIADTPNYNEWINIGDTNQKYKKIVIRFKKPLVFKAKDKILKSRISFEVETAVIPKVWSTWTKQNLGNNTSKSNNLPNSVNYKFYTEENKTPTVSTATANGYYVASTAKIAAHEGQYEIISKIYDGTPVILNTGHRKTDNPNNDITIKNIKHYTLIPSDLLFNIEKSSFLPNSTYQIVKNFKGTGKTALIVDIGDSVDNSSSNRMMKIAIDGTPIVSEEVQDVTHYLTWDEASDVIPYQAYTNSYFVANDELDLDNNNDRTDKVLKYVNRVQFIPPKEIVQTKEISRDKMVWSHDLEHLDIGEEFFYRVNIINKTTVQRGGVSIIDVLPYINDHAIVANNQGQYLNRGSVYPISLNQFLEDTPDNTEILKKWDIFYSTSAQGANLDATKKATWVKKSGIKNIRDVKLIKFELKSGINLNEGEKHSFIIVGKVPSNRALSLFSLAQNSAAFSLNKNTYTEGNKVSSAIVKYKVNGYIFKDTNIDGIKQDNELLANQIVKLMNANGTEYRDDNNQPVTAVTNAQGYYDMSVYKRGTYYVEVVKTDKQETTIKHSKEGTRKEKDNLIGNDGLVGMDATKIKTNPFTLGVDNIITKPDSMNDDQYESLMKTKENSLMATRNIGIIDKLTINGEKTWNDYGNRANSRPANIKVQLYADGKLKETKTVSGPNWTYQFADLPQVVNNKKVVYRIDEEAVAKYTKVVNGYNLTNRYSPTGVVGKIKVVKVDVANENIKLQGVTFQLKKGNQVLQTKETDVRGEILFENVAFGDYTLVETKTKAGYVLNNMPIPVSLVVHGETVTQKVTNEQATTDVNITKVDVANRNTKLDGVVFKLLNGATANSATLQEKTTTRDGKLSFTKLKPGTYYIKETKTKAGYVVLQNYYRLVVKSDLTVELYDGNTRVQATGHSHLKITGKEIEVANAKRREFPKTGGVGIEVYIGAGTVLVASALYMNKKKKTR